MKAVMNNPIVQRAGNFAMKAHAGQTYNGHTYFEGHLFPVANYASKFTSDPELISGCLLHDTDEDTEVTLNDIEKEFGPRIKNMVDAVTDGEGETRKEKKVSSYAKLAYSPDGRFVKLCDRTVNMMSSMGKTKYANLYISESEEFVSKLFIMGEYVELWAEYHKVLEKLKSSIPNPNKIQHNHITRDIKLMGGCPACDQYHTLIAAKAVISDALIEINVHADDADMETERIIKYLSLAGISFVLEKK